MCGLAQGRWWSWLSQDLVGDGVGSLGMETQQGGQRGGPALLT